MKSFNIEPFKLVYAQIDKTRLDAFLAKEYQEISRAIWINLIEESKVLVNGNSVKPAYNLKINDVVELSSSASQSSFMQQLENFTEYKGPSVEVVYHDDDILVVNKPIGISVHPNDHDLLINTLVGFLITNNYIDYKLWSDEYISEGRPGIVHRLDKGTSGLLLCARNQKSADKIKIQFKNRTCTKEYEAVVDNNFFEIFSKIPSKVTEHIKNNIDTSSLIADEQINKVSIGTLISRDKKYHSRYWVSDKGKMAISHFYFLKKVSNGDLVKINIETGRTHQIRVHCKFLNKPIVGDSLYAGPKSDRIYLHASKLKFIHPESEKQMVFDSPSNFI